jgi:hypothetical protein
MAKAKPKTGTKKTTTAKPSAGRQKPATKKSTARKSQTSKNPVAKKPVAKKPSARQTKPQRAKPIAQAKAKPKTAKTTGAKLLSLQLSATRRPSPSPLIPQIEIDSLTEHLDLIKGVLEDYAAHLRALDRKRHNGVGIRRQGFIERSYQLALENQEFLPHWLPMAKFREDNDHFLGLRTFFDLTEQIRELAWNLVTLAADMVYTDALEFYSQVQDAANRRIDAAESIYHELRPFFEAHGNRRGDEPTEAEQERDAKALIKGKKDGKMVIENVKPKMTAGKHKVIDEKFTDSASFKETDEGSIEE